MTEKMSNVPIRFSHQTGNWALGYAYRDNPRIVVEGRRSSTVFEDDTILLGAHHNISDTWAHAIAISLPSRSGGNRSVLWPEERESETSSMLLSTIGTLLAETVGDSGNEAPKWLSDAESALKDFCTPKNLEISEKLLRAIAKTTSRKPKISRSPDSGVAVSFIRENCAISIVAEFDIALIIENYQGYNVEMIFDVPGENPQKLLRECSARLSAFFLNWAEEERS